MNTIERIKMVKAMEFIARQINDEMIFDHWLTGGVADGDIEYGDLTVKADDAEMLEYYLEDDNFKDLMQLFLRLMASAKKSGGLYADGVVAYGGCMKAWDWHFEAEDGGLNCSGGWPLKSEAEAMKAGKRWMRETKRKGTITAKQVQFATVSYIADY